MKKLATLLTGAAAFCAAAVMMQPAFALTEGDWEFQLLNNEATITAYNGDDENVVIPSEIGGVPVTKVEGGNEDFFEDKNVVSVVFPAGVKTINSVCWNSQTLQSVTLPEGVEELAENAFMSCSSLSEINLPSTLKTIGSYAFMDCGALESVEIPGGLETLGSSSFYKSGLKEIDLSDCTNLQLLYREQFGYCEDLVSAKLPPNITEVPHGIFEGCTALTSAELPAGITLIDVQAFSGCTSLKSIILPTSLKRIDNNAFNNCGLTEVILPYGVTSVSYAFGCHNGEPSLKAIYIPSTVESMSSSIIEGQENAIIYCPENSPAAEVCAQYSISYLTDNSADSPINVLYNGSRISFHNYGQNPQLINDRTMVPLRSIFETMGAEVSWDGAAQTASAKRGDIEISIAIGADSMTKNGQTIPVDVPAQLINDRTMIPVRVIAEAFGADVQWNGPGQTVLITEQV